MERKGHQHFKARPLSIFRQVSDGDQLDLTLAQFICRLLRDAVISDHGAGVVF